MARPFPEKSYGDLSVRGNAHVQQGDNHVHIGTLNIPLDNLVAAFHSAIDYQSNKQAPPKLLRAGSKRRPRWVKKPVRPPGKLRTRAIQSTGAQTDRPPGNTWVTDDENDTTSMNTLSSLLTLGRRIMQFLLERATVQGGRLLQTDEVPVQEHCSPDAQALMCINQGSGKINHEPSIVAALLTSCIVGRHISSDDFTAFLASCGQDDLLPLLLIAIVIGCYRSYVLRTILRQPPQKFWTLEDAYGCSIEISVDVLVDFSIFRQRLQVHYIDARRRTGLLLVKADHFHLMLGSRRGTVIGKENWANTSSLIKPGRKAVNSVWIDTKKKACLWCSTALTMTSFGELHCSSCNTFHRDYSTFGLQQTGTVRMMIDDTSQAATSRNHQKMAQSYTDGQIDLNAQGQHALSKHEIYDLKHLDFRLVPSIPQWQMDGSPTIRRLSVPGDPATTSSSRQRTFPGRRFRVATPWN